VAVSVAPKFHLSTLIFPAVAVVEVKICKGVWCGKVVSEGPEAIAGFVGADNRPGVRERRDCDRTTACTARPHADAR
jgi:hypothetical protein